MSCTGSNSGPWVAHDPGDRIRLDQLPGQANDTSGVSSRDSPTDIPRDDEFELISRPCSPETRAGDEWHQRVRRLLRNHRAIGDEATRLQAYRLAFEAEELRLEDWVLEMADVHTPDATEAYTQDRTSPRSLSTSMIAEYSPRSPISSMNSSQSISMTSSRSNRSPLQFGHTLVGLEEVGAQCEQYFFTGPPLEPTESETPPGDENNAQPLDDAADED